MKVANIQIRVSSDLRKKTDRVLEGIGIDLTTAIRMFMNQVVYTKSIPFDVKLPENESNHLEVVEVTPAIQAKMDKIGDALDLALKKRKAK